MALTLAFISANFRRLLSSTVSSSAIHYVNVLPLPRCKYIRQCLADVADGDSVIKIALYGGQVFSLYVLPLTHVPRLVASAQDSADDFSGGYTVGVRHGTQDSHFNGDPINAFQLLL